MKYHKNILETIGNTPLIKLNNLTKEVDALVLAKVEFFNPGSSIKDRMALKMIEDAENDGRLKPGYTIVEGTSGNTGNTVNNSKMLIIPSSGYLKFTQAQRECLNSQNHLTQSIDINNKSIQNGNVRSLWASSNYGYYNNEWVRKPKTNQSRARRCATSTPCTRPHRRI